MTYLLLRLASLGNVAMLAPVLASAAAAHPEDRFIVVAKKDLTAMFFGMKNVAYHSVVWDPDRTFTFRSLAHANYHAIHQLLDELLSYEPDVVLDMEDSWYTRWLSGLMRFRGKRVVVIDNGRMDKQVLITRGARHSQPLQSEFDRYADVLRRAGVTSDQSFEALAVDENAKQAVIARFGTKEQRWFGIAPFAKSKSNMLPYQTTKELIAHYAQFGRVFLFGAGEVETEVLQQWASVFPNSVSVAGVLPLSQELELMRMLDAMVCMDSANKHLAALVGLHVTSIWCGTHPYMGYAAWKQPEQHMLQHDLPCRPCTVNGTNQCQYGNFLCRQISAAEIIDRQMRVAQI